jgi:hypothetical protein
LVVVENLMFSVLRETRVLTLHYVNEKKDGNFRWFASYALCSSRHGELEHPEDMPTLAAVLGFAFWYLVYFVHTT